MAALVALQRKQLGAAGLLLAFGYLSLRYLRFQALFAVVTVVVAAPYLSGWSKRVWLKSSHPSPTSAKAKARRELPKPVVARSWPILSFLAICILLIVIRAHDLISERAYIAAGQPTLFGAGISSWYPVHAAEFVLRERLPGNIFHEYNMGGYFAFRLGPQYPDYIDGRAIPFGGLMFEQRSVMKQPPDSAA